MYRSARNSALLPGQEPGLLPELEPLVLVPVPLPLLGPLSVSEPMPEPVSVSACSREQQDPPYTRHW